MKCKDVDKALRGICNLSVSELNGHSLREILESLWEEGYIDGYDESQSERKDNE